MAKVSHGALCAVRGALRFDMQTIQWLACETGLSYTTVRLAVARLEALGEVEVDREVSPYAVHAVPPVRAEEQLLRVLRTRDRGPFRALDLARETGLSLSHIYNQLDKLQRQGYVERQNLYTLLPSEENP